MVDWDSISWDIFKINNQWVVKESVKNSKPFYNARGVSKRTVISLLKTNPNDFNDALLNLKEKQVIQIAELQHEWNRVRYTTIMPKREQS